MKIPVVGKVQSLLPWLNDTTRNNSSFAAAMGTKMGSDKICLGNDVIIDKQHQIVCGFNKSAVHRLRYGRLVQLKEPNLTEGVEPQQLALHVMNMGLRLVENEDFSNWVVQR
jgi:hypothetical protein